jgi:hypothetical protein
VQGNWPCASRLRASGVRAIQEQCAGDATGRGDPAGGYAGVPTVFLQHTCVSGGSSTREQEKLEVHEGVGIANQSSPTGFFLESTTSSSSYPSPIVRARPQVTTGITPSAILYPLQSLASFFVTHGTSSPSSTSRRQSSSPWDFTFHPFFSTTKVCPDQLNLLNAGDSFAGTSSLSFRSLFSRIRDLIALIQKVLGCSL